MTVRIFGINNTRSTRALWALEEAECDYEYIQLNGREGALTSPEYLAVHPGGKVPAMTHNDFLLTESGAIVSYIADTFAPGRLIPNVGTQERAMYNQWSLFVLTELEQTLWTIGKHKFALPRDWRVPEVIETAKKEFAKALAILADGLGDREFMVGNNFSMADVLVGHTLMWAQRFRFEIQPANLKAYGDRVCQRPALIRAKAREEAAGFSLP